MWSFFIFFLNLKVKNLILSYPHQSVYLAYYPQTNHLYYKNPHLTDFQFY